MYKYPENRKQFGNKFKLYENYGPFLRFIAEYEEYKYGFNLLYKCDQVGGSKIKDQIDTILKTYTKYNLRIDEEESSDNEVKVLFFTIDDKNICMGLIIDNLQKFATISDLRNWPNCIPNQDKDLMNMLFKFSIEVATQCNMTHIKLSDRSYHVCKGDNRFNLSMANTLTDGEPYYYKYGFVYESTNNYEDVINNKLKLENMITSELDYIELMTKIKNRLSVNKCEEEFIWSQLKHVAKIYEKHLNNNIKIFLKELKYKHCFMFCTIYAIIWDLLNLRLNLNTSMIMTL